MKMTVNEINISVAERGAFGINKLLACKNDSLGEFGISSLVADDLSLAKLNDPVCIIVGIVQIMRNDENQAFLRKLLQKLHDRLCRIGIQISRRLVRKDDTRLLDDGTGNRNSLLFTARKLRGVSVLVARKVDLFESRSYLVAVLDPSEVQRKHDVFVDRQLVDEVIILKNKADVRISVITKVLFLKFRKIVSVDLDASARDVIQTADEVEKRGFSASALTEHENKPLVPEREIDIRKRVALTPFF